MSVQDVEGWVERIISDILPFRPHLDPEIRELQREVLRNLGTRTIQKPNKKETETEPARRGFIFEELVRSEPEYQDLRATMSEAEQALSAYILQFLRTKKLSVSLTSSTAFYNPDEIIVWIEAQVAFVAFIIEIKRTAASKQARTQLALLTSEIRLIAILLTRELKSLRSRGQSSSKMCQIKGVNWPKGLEVKSIELDPRCRKILYLPAEQRTKVPAWEIRHSVFTALEAGRIAAVAWKDLVAQGGATKETGQEARKANQSAGVAVVREHEEGKGSSMTTEPAENKVCMVLEDGVKCQELIPTDRVPFSVEGRECCDPHAIKAIVGQVKDTAAEIKDIIDQTKEIDPTWDPSEVGQAAQAMFNEVRSQHLPERKFALAASIVRDARATVFLGAVDKHLAAARAKALSHQGTAVYVDLIIAQIDDLAKEKETLQKKPPQEKRSKAENLYQLAVRLRESAEGIPEIAEALKGIDLKLAEVKEAAEPFSDTVAGREVLQKVEWVALHRQDFDDPGYKERNSLLLKARKLLEFVREQAAVDLETAAERERSNAKLMPEDAFDLGFGSKQKASAGSIEGQVEAFFENLEEAISAPTEPGKCLNPECGKLNPADQKFCGNCGKALPQPEVEMQDDSSENGSDQAQRDSGKCPVCNADNPPNQVFCGECGYNFTEAKKSVNEELRETIDKMGAFRDDSDDTTNESESSDEDSSAVQTTDTTPDPDASGQAEDEADADVEAQSLNALSADQDQSDEDAAVASARDLGKADNGGDAAKTDDASVGGEVETVAKDQAAVATETATATQSKFCVECGKPLPPVAKFCPECGVSLSGA